MATGTSTTTSGTGPAPTVKLVGYDQFIDKQLRSTRAQVRIVNVASGLLVLATGTLAYFLAIALVDHWTILGGLPGWARLAALLVYMLGAGWYFATRLLPLFIKRINPLYAAETIERTQPSLKNSLLNFLMFRARPQGLPESVYHAVEEQAASSLARVHIETVVDRSKLIKIGYVLAGVLALCAFYKVFSPKDPFLSVGRVVMPWADLLPPTRVTIDNIQPGSSKAFRGQKVSISAEVRGLDRDGIVTLIYTTADGQTVDRSVEMHVPQDGYRYTCALPPDSDGIQQTVRYRIVAGDARSRDYTITVVAAPTIVVDSIEYLYPEYTGLMAQKIDHQGDIKAIEGTKVIVHAVTNQPIKSGGLDFDCDGREDLPLAIDGTGDLARGATVLFPLSLEKDRVTPTHTSYQLLFKNEEGDQNQQPIRHKIEVIADVAPEIEFLAPKKDEVLVREGDVLPIELTAIDPDFALQRVKVLATVDGRRALEQSLIKSPRHGQFNHKFRLSTREHNFKAGEVVEYWAVAEDIKSPKPNVVETLKRRIRIVPRDTKNQPNQDQQDGREQPPLEGEQEKSPRDEQGKNQEQGDQESDNKSQEGNSPPNAKSSSKDGKGKQGKQDQNSGEGQQSGDQQQNEKSQPGEKSSGDDSSGKSGEPQKSPTEGSPKDNSKQKGGQQNSGQAGAPKEPVPSDGSDDGQAFDEAFKHIEEKEQKEQQNGKGQKNQQEQQSGQTKNENPGSKPSPKENKQTPGQNEGGEEKPSSKNPPSDKPQDDNSGDPSGDEKKGQEQSGESGSPNAKKKNGEKGGANGQEQAGEPTDDAQQGENSQKGEASEGVSKNAKEQQGDPGEDGQAQKTGQKPTGQGKPPKDSKPGEASSGSPRDQKDGEKSEQPGQGGNSKSDDRNNAKKKSDPNKPQEDAKGGSDEQEKGQSGAGRPSDNQEGAPDAQGDNRQRDKKQKSSSGQQDDESKTEAQSPSNSNRQSDSKESQSDGDRSGAGEAGGGQKANEPGAGGEGQNTSSDEGAGKSDEQGSGETGSKAGPQQQSDSRTGKSGNEKGEGSQSRRGEKSGQGKAEQKSQAGKPQGDRGQSEKEGSQQPGASGNGPPNGTPMGGQEGQPNSSSPPPAGTKTPVDDANLDFTRKATDLVLDRLRDQLRKGEPDQELLDKLGWTRDDMEKFVRRWEQLRATANQNDRKGEDAKRELDASLRSLGLHPRRTTLGGNRAADDTQRGLKESRRTSPPSEYAEQYKAYTQGTARGNK